MDLQITRKRGKHFITISVPYTKQKTEKDSGENTTKKSKKAFYTHSILCR